MRIYAQVIILVTLSGFSLSTLAQSDLPPRVQADLLLRQLATQVKTNEFDQALATINEYRALGIEMPPPLMLTEAKLAFATGDNLRTTNVLEAYFEVGPHEGENYNEALRLYEQVPPQPKFYEPYTRAVCNHYGPDGSQSCIWPSKRWESEEELDAEYARWLKVRDQLKAMGIREKEKGKRMQAAFCTSRAVRLIEFDYKENPRHPGGQHSEFPLWLITPFSMNFIPSEDFEDIQTLDISHVEQVAENTRVLTAHDHQNYDDRGYYPRIPSTTRTWRFESTRDGFEVKEEGVDRRPLHYKRCTHGFNEDLTEFVREMDNR